MSILVCLSLFIPLFLSLALPLPPSLSLSLSLFLFATLTFIPLRLTAGVCTYARPNESISPDRRIDSMIRILRVCD